MSLASGVMSSASELRWPEDGGGMYAGYAGGGADAIANAGALTFLLGVVYRAGRGRHCREYDTKAVSSLRADR